MRSRLVVVVFLCLSVSLSAQPRSTFIIYLQPIDPVAVAKGLEILVTAVRNWGDQRNMVNDGLASARSAFWAEYPDGPRVKEASLALIEALTARDLANAAIDANRGLVNGTGLSDPMKKAVLDYQKNIGTILDALTSRGNRLETLEKAPRFAQAAFDRWVAKLVSGARQGLSREAIYDGAMEEYRAYVPLRDRAEIVFNNPKGPFTSSDANVMTAGLMLTCPTLAWDDAMRLAGAFISATGDSKTLLSAASVLAQRVLAGDDQFSRRCTAPLALASQLERKSPMVFVLHRLAVSGGGAPNYSLAAEQLAAWERQVGRARIEREGARVRTAVSIDSYRASGLPAEAARLQPSLDLPDACLNLGYIGCLSSLLGVEAPPFAVAPAVRPAAPVTSSPGARGGGGETSRASVAEASVPASGDPVPQGSILAGQLQSIDVRLFTLRSRLYGLDEETAIDRIRELWFKAWLNADREAMAQAAAEGEGLLDRFRRRPVGDAALTLNMLSVQVRRMQDQLGKWGDGPSGAGVQPGGGPERDEVVKRALASHRGEKRGVFTSCAFGGQRGFTIDGLPPGPLTVVLDSPVPYKVVESPAGHSRIVFDTSSGRICAKGSWAAGQQ